MKLSEFQTRTFKLFAMSLDHRPSDKSIKNWQLALQKMLDQQFLPMSNGYASYLAKMEELTQNQLKILIPETRKTNIFIKISDYKTSDSLNDQSCSKLLALLELILLKDQKNISVDDVLSGKSRKSSTFLRAYLKKNGQWLKAYQQGITLLVNECFSRLDISDFANFDQQPHYVISNGDGRDFRLGDIIEVSTAQKKNSSETFNFLISFDEIMETEDVEFRNSSISMSWDAVKPFRRGPKPDPKKTVEQPLIGHDGRDEQQRKEPNFEVRPIDQQQDFPKTKYEAPPIEVSVESVDPLAVYFYGDSRIEMYVFKIKASAFRNGFNLQSLFKKVLVHELGHYFSHQALCNNSKTWIDIGKVTSFITEGIAQFFTREVLSVMDQASFFTYMSFLKQQPEAYQGQELWVKHFGAQAVIDAFIQFRTRSFGRVDLMDLVQQRYDFERLILNAKTQQSYRLTHSSFTMIYCPPRILNYSFRSALMDHNTRHHLGYYERDGYLKGLDSSMWFDQTEKKQEVNAFWISQTQVTEQMWLDVMGWRSYRDNGNLPTRRFSYYDALDFCNRLSLKSGFTPYYILSDLEYDDENIRKAKVTIQQGNGYRLPNLAEWMVAAQADCQFKYAGGNEIDDVAWYSGNSAGHIQPVAQKIPNAWQIFDMSGNLSTLLDNLAHIGGDCRSPKALCEINNPILGCPIDVYYGYYSSLRLVRSL